MVVRDDFVSLSDGDQLNDGYFNGNYNNNKIQQIYTGSGFDVSVSGAAQDTSASHELTVVASSALVDVTRIVIETLVSSTAACDLQTSGGSTSRLQIETKDVGGSYSDTLAETVITGVSTGAVGAGAVPVHNNLQKIRWVHTLSANEIANGVQVKITGRCVTQNDSNASASITNKQTIISTIR